MPTSHQTIDSPSLDADLSARPSALSADVNGVPGGQADAAGDDPAASPSDHSGDVGSSVPVIPTATEAIAAEAPATQATATQANATKATATQANATKAAATKAGPAKAGSARTTAAKTGARKAEPLASDWSPVELEQVRVELADNLGEMQAEYETSLRELNELQSSSTDGAGDDQADAGSKTFDREQELSIAANRLDLISQITHAIERVDKGTYGLCEVCGQPIPRVRLEAFPMATLDVACKQREERR